MSIRLKQLLLLLAIALLPVAVSGWYSIRQFDAMASTVADATRTQIRERDRHYMIEKVADIGKRLRLTAQSTANYLQQQKLLVEQAFSTDLSQTPASPQPFSAQTTVSTLVGPTASAPDSDPPGAPGKPSFLIAPGDGRRPLSEPDDVSPLRARWYRSPPLRASSSSHRPTPR